MVTADEDEYFLSQNGTTNGKLAQWGWCFQYNYFGSRSVAIIASGQVPQLTRHNFRLQK